MQKRVIKDIQVKKKTAPAISKPASKFDVPNKTLIKETSEIKLREPIKKAPIVIKDEGSTREAVQTQPKKIIEPAVTSTDFSPFEDQIYSYKPKKSISRKSRIAIILSILGVVFLMTIIYVITGTNIEITPKIVETNVNESINISSWTAPIKSTVMILEENSLVNDNEDDTKTALDQKIKDRIKFDMPLGYMMVPGCKTGTYYETITTESKQKELKAKVTALIIEEASLKNYLVKNLKLDGREIKEIFNLNCELKTDISKYSAGKVANNLSILISGKIKSEYIIDEAEIRSNILGKSKSTANNFLSNREGILSYSMKSRPINLIHLIPKNPNHLHVSVLSNL